MKRLLAAAALAAAVAVPRLASAGSEPNAVAVEISRFVLPEESWNKLQQAMEDQVRQMVEHTLQQAGAKASPELPARLAEETRKLLTYAEMVDLQAGLLAKYYTEPEMKELLAFYRTPLGQKQIRIMPEMLQDVNNHMMALLQQRLPPMMERLRPLLEQAGAGKTPAAAPAKKAKKQAN
ncbi:MAG TPA: DUF2059 domain-containing protein [Anaeromyxobacter sp.]